jgi:hypothetical protein
MHCGSVILFKETAYSHHGCVMEPGIVQKEKMSRIVIPPDIVDMVCSCAMWMDRVCL